MISENWKHFDSIISDIKCDDDMDDFEENERRLQVYNGFGDSDENIHEFFKTIEMIFYKISKFCFATSNKFLKAIKN